MSSTQLAGFTTSAPHAPPPPAGYPIRSDGGDQNQFSQNPEHFSPETKPKGDGFWKGWMTGKKEVTVRREHKDVVLGVGAAGLGAEYEAENQNLNIKYDKKIDATKATTKGVNESKVVGIGSAGPRASAKFKGGTTTLTYSGPIDI